MACRNAARAREAEARLLSEVPNARVTSLLVDMSEPESVHAFGRSFAERVDHLDVVIHNAGVFGVPLARNSAGHELHLATNYLAPYTLTALLLPFFRAPSGGRVVHVGSLASRFCKLGLGELHRDESEYKAAAAYARSKLALLSHSMELNRRLQKSGSKVIAVSAHPGFAPTEGARTFSLARHKSALGRFWVDKAQGLLSSVAQAARPILHAACAEGVRGGEYYGPGGWLEISGAPAKARVNRSALDEELARNLWSTAEKLSGVRYLTEQ